MLRLAFDFIITWRETRTRPNAYREFIEYLHKTVTSPDRDARDKKTESTRPATGNQAATERDHRSGSHLKAAEPRSGNMQAS